VGCSLCGSSGIASSAATAPIDTTGFALVLGGGGARGLAHIGVLEILEELEMRPSLIVGTSMGAVVGAIAAAGHPAAKLRELATSQRWIELLLDRGISPVRVQGGWSGLPMHQLRLRLDRWPPVPPAGASRGQAIETILGTLTADALLQADADFDRLPIPFRCLATDVVSAEATVFSSGPLPVIVRASGSIPVVFQPVELEGRVYLDGGLSDNLPVEVARELGFRRCVVVDVSNIFLPVEDPSQDLFSLINRAAQLSQLRQNQVEARPDDVVLRVDLREHSSLGFWGVEEIIERGRGAALEARQRLLDLRAKSRPAATRPAAPPAHVGVVRIAELRIEGSRKLSPWSIRRRLDLEPGDEIQLAELWERAGLLAQQSIFENVWLEASARGEAGVEVVVHVQERHRPELELAANYRQGDGPALLLRLRLDNWLGTGGGRALSWRLGEQESSLIAHLTQPLRGSRRNDLRILGGWMRERAEIYDEGDEVDAWVFRRVAAEFGGIVGLFLDRRLSLLLGLRAASVDRHLESRQPGTAGSDQLRAVHVGVETWRHGGLSHWPPRGLSVHFYQGLSALGGDVKAWWLNGGSVWRSRTAGPWGWNGALGFAWGSRELPVAFQARAGGTDGWVGLRRDEVIAPRLLWQRLGLDWYVQPELRVEAAGALGLSTSDQLRKARPRVGALLQLVLDSIIGPLQLGVQGSHRGESFLFLDVGHEF
jgi:predicted acylesterase/phospholipase RssA